jgi:hypothetical protein
LLVHIFGPRAEAEVSAFFQLLDYGMVTTPKQFLGKSGVVAAMKLHGLKVLVPRKLSLPDYDRDLATYSDTITSAPPAQFESAATAQQLMSDLSNIA